jgi:hypothetical protein
MNYEVLPIPNFFVSWLKSHCDFDEQSGLHFLICISMQVNGNVYIYFLKNIILQYTFVNVKRGTKHRGSKKK